MARHPTGKLRHIGAPGWRSAGFGSAQGTVHAFTLVWGARVERMLAHCQPLLNCLLFLVGVYTAAQHPPKYLTWIGIPQQLLAASDDWQPLVAKLGMYIGVCALILATIDGAGSRRIFASLSFPFLLSAGETVSALATRASMLVPLSSGDMLWATLVRGSLFGLTAALLLCLPITFIYRTRVTPIAGLLLMPAAARAAAKQFYWVSANSSYLHLLLQGWSYIAFLIVVGLLYKLMKRLVLTDAAPCGQEHTEPHC
jgi:hypothetical protein